MFWRGVDFAAIPWDNRSERHAHTDLPARRSPSRYQNEFRGALLAAALAMGAPLIFAAMAGLAFTALGGH